MNRAFGFLGTALFWAVSTFTRPLFALVGLAIVWLTFGPSAVTSILDANMLMLKGVAGLWSMFGGGAIPQTAVDYLDKAVGGMKWLGGAPEKYLPPALNFGPSMTAALVLILEAVPLLAELFVLRLLILAISIPRRIIKWEKKRMYIVRLEQENMMLKANAGIRATFPSVIDLDAERVRRA